MDRLCFGGTFDPIHFGHLITARAAAEAAGCGHVTIIPNYRSPLKDKSEAPATRRLDWCRLAVDGDPFFDVSDVEILRSTPSYTIDTVEQLERVSGKRVHWLIGADCLPTLPSWHRAAELLSSVRFVVMRRPGYEIEWTRLSPIVQPLRQNVVDVPLIQISSTDIRQRVQDGRSIRYLVPASVEAEIFASGVYRTSTE